MRWNNLQMPSPSPDRQTIEDDLGGQLIYLRFIRQLLLLDLGLNTLLHYSKVI